MAIQDILRQIGASNYYQYIWIVRIIIVIIMTVFAYLVYDDYHEKIVDSVFRLLKRSNTKLDANEKQKEKFDERLKKLKAYGVLDKHPSLSKPVNYILWHVATGLIGMFAASFFDVWLMPVGFIAGYYFLDFVFSHGNQNDNMEMNEDVMSMYNLMNTQLQGGVYPGEAMCKIRPLIENKRLKNALAEYERHFRLNDITLKENLDDFESRFDNQDISALALILKQNEESGKSSSIMDDIQHQINDANDVLNQSKKESLERIMTIVMLVLFLDIMGFILYMFVTNIMNLM